MLPHYEHSRKSQAGVLKPADMSTFDLSLAQIREIGGFTALAPHSAARPVLILYSEVGQQGCVDQTPLAIARILSGHAWQPTGSRQHLPSFVRTSCRLVSRTSGRPAGSLIMPDAAPAHVRFKGTALGFPASRAASPVRAQFRVRLPRRLRFGIETANHGGSQAKEITNDYTSEEFSVLV
jgi:hypothetical protein